MFSHLKHNQLANSRQKKQKKHWTSRFGLINHLFRTFNRFLNVNASFMPLDGFGIVGEEMTIGARRLSLFFLNINIQQYPAKIVTKGRSFQKSLKFFLICTAY